ncbi:MAG: hypothetical protein ACXWM6_04885 [Thermodesulfobacteriota bacterium]
MKSLKRAGQEKSLTITTNKVGSFRGDDYETRLVLKTNDLTVERNACLPVGRGIVGVAR